MKKHLAKEQEKEKRKDQSPNKKQHLKAQNAQWGRVKKKNQVT
jgi:hypothetical protein